MAKWCGKIGYVETVETEPGIWNEISTERTYYGDTYRNSRLIQNSGGVNSDVNIANQISIVSDPYANCHIYSIRYVEFQGSFWQVTNVEVQQPRLILTIGGLYNEKQTGTTE